MRLAGTRRAVASAFAVIPSGARNSSCKISPGWAVMRRRGVMWCSSMIIADLDVGRSLLCPFETQAKLIVDAHAVLPVPIALQRLEPVAGRRAQIIERSRGVEHIELPLRLLSNLLGRQSHSFRVASSAPSRSASRFAPASRGW